MRFEYAMFEAIIQYFFISIRLILVPISCDDNRIVSKFMQMPNKRGYALGSYEISRRIIVGKD